MLISSHRSLNFMCLVTAHDKSRTSEDSQTNYSRKLTLRRYAFSVFLCPHVREPYQCFSEPAARSLPVHIPRIPCKGYFGFQWCLFVLSFGLCESSSHTV